MGIKRNEKRGSGVVQTLLCDLSGISWKKLIKRDVLELDTVQIIVSQGGLLEQRDLKCIDKVSLLHFAMDNCTPRLSEHDVLIMFETSLKCNKFIFAESIAERNPSVGDGDLNALILTVLKEKKFELVAKIMRFQTSSGLHHLIHQVLKSKDFNLIAELITYGAEINVAHIVKEMRKSDFSSNEDVISYIKSTLEGRIQLILKALELSEYSFAESLLDSATVSSKISVSSVLKYPCRGNSVARKQYISFVKKLLDDGANPNGEDGEEGTLDIVLSHQTDAEKIELLTLLLQHDAKIERYTYQSMNQTTLLHIATTFALDSGNVSNFFWLAILYELSCL